MSEIFNYHLDRLRVWTACLVVLSHSIAFIPSEGSPLWLNFLRISLQLMTPIFFTLSGYLLAERSQDYLRAYGRRTWRLFLGASLAYWLFNFVLTALGLQEASHSLTWDHFLSGTWGSVHLWFLFALCLALPIYQISRSYPWPSLVLGFLLYYSRYWVADWPYLHSLSQYGGVLEAIFFLNLGNFLARMQKTKVPLPGSDLGRFITSLLGLSLYLVTYYYLPWNFLSSLLGSGVIAWIFLNALNPQRSNQASWINVWSQDTKALYLYHFGWLQILEIIFSSQLTIPWSALFYGFLPAILLSILTHRLLLNIQKKTS